MTLQAIIFPEWRDENRNRKYPFSDTATLVSDDSLELPEAAFFDARLYPVGGGARQHLSAVIVDVGVLTFEVSDEVRVRGTGEFSQVSPEETIFLFDGYGRPAGVLVCDPDQLSTLLGWAPGRHAFSVAASEFVSSVVVPVPERNVSAFVLQSEDAFFGDVWLVGGDGVVLREDGADVVRVDVVGDPYYTRRACDKEPTAVYTPRFLKRINGMRPDALGNFIFSPGSAREDNVLRIEPEYGGLHIFLAGA
jgi:hypothetical protein